MKAPACTYFGGIRAIQTDHPNVAVSIKRSDHAKISKSVIENWWTFGVVSLPVTDNRLEAQMIHRDELFVIDRSGIMALGEEERYCG